MMHDLDLILYLLAAVAFAAAAVNVTHKHVNLVALGLLAAVLVPLISLART